MGSPAGPAVETTGLVVRYGKTVAVDGVDLAADRGEVLALLGRNGAGKTSTVEALEGYRRVAGGQVRVLGLDPQRPGDHRRLVARVGVMLQAGGVYPAMSPAEAVRLFARYYRDPTDPAGLIERLGLTAVAGTPWRRLSGGEQQRLSLALALVGRPEVVFLDEPTAGVDAHGRIAIRQEIGALRAAGVCVLLTTHELPEAEKLADRIAIIDRGRVVAAGTPAELTGLGGPGSPAGPGAGGPIGPGAGIRFGASAGLDVAALTAHLGTAVRESSPGEYVVAGPGRPATIAALATWLAERDLALRDLRTDRPTLEEVFLRLTGADPARTEGGEAPGAEPEGAGARGAEPEGAGARGADPGGDRGDRPRPGRRRDRRRFGR